MGQRTKTDLKGSSCTTSLPSAEANKDTHMQAIELQLLLHHVHTYTPYVSGSNLNVCHFVKTCCSQVCLVAE